VPSSAPHSSGSSAPAPNPDDRVLGPVQLVPDLDEPAEVRLTVLSGPSGVGKDAVLAAVRRRHPEVWVSTSVTTRPPRPNETDGVEYHFVDRDRFAEMVEAGELLEHAEYAGNLYGTPREPVVRRLAEGRAAFLVIELQGMRQVRKLVPDAQFVFLAPPSFAELERRLLARATEPGEAIRQRLDQARIELASEPEFDVTVVNDSVERAADELVTLIEHPVSRPRK
jgi:guanylate kinase